jgi:hypothetical protein
MTAGVHRDGAQTMVAARKVGKFAIIAVVRRVLDVPLMDAVHKAV